MSLASRKLIQATAGNAAGAGEAVDDDFANVVLLLDGDGTSDDNNETFTDSSTNGFTVTKTGSVVQGSFSPYGDNWSNYFDGTGDNFVVTETGSEFEFGTGDFTVECWFYENSLVGDFVLLGSTAGENIYFGYGNVGSGGMSMYAGSPGTDIYSGSSNTPESGQWNHLVWQRSSGNAQMYLNGTRVYNAAYTASFNGTISGFRIGASDSYNNYYADGFISNFRVVKGSAVYSGASFTVPSSPLSSYGSTSLLTCQSNRFVDENNNRTITLAGTPKVSPFSPFKDDDARDITTDGGSAYWNGSSYLNTASGATALGTGNFTVEFWINTTDTRFNIMNPDSSTGNGFWGLMVQSGDLRWNDQYNLTNLWVVDGSPILDGAWHHVAIIKNSNVFKVFYDGVSQSIQSGSFTDSFNYPYSDGLRIGSGNLATFTGYLSDIRLLAGTALYSSDFTPPTSPLTAVTNTKLLLNFQDAGIYDRTGINNIDTVGDARLGFAPIYGTGSLAFDGSGDAIQNLNADVVIGSDDFTVEAWVYFNATNQDCILSTRLSTGTSNGFLFTAYQNKVQFFSGGSFILTGTTTLTTGQWYHIALAREGSTLRLFVDGSLEDSVSNTTNYSDTYLRVGKDVNSGYDFSGYMDDFRITKGVARYTSDFTPPDEIDLSTDTHRKYVTLFLDGDGTANGQNNTFTDSSINDFTVTEGGSVVQGVFSPYGDNWSNSFDGSGGYLQFPTGYLAGVTTGDFTIEGWWYFNDFDIHTTYFQRLWSFGTGIADDVTLNVFTDGDLAVRFNDGIKAQTSVSGGLLNLGEWNHIAVVRNSGTVYIYANGTPVASGSFTDNINTKVADPIYIGSEAGGGGGYLSGYCSNFRVSDTALYTSSFTPSTTPLNSIASTGLLTCQSNNFKDNSTNNATVTLGGTPKVSRFSPFESDKPYDITTDGGSAYFDGVKTTQLYAGTSNVIPATGDFTVEGWVYFTGLNTVNNRSVFFVKDSGTTSSGNRSFQILLNNNGTKYDDVSVALFQSNSSFDGSVFTHTFEFNEWYHIAVTRTGQTIECFINGTSIGTDTNSITSINQTTEENYIASWNSSNKDDTHVGYFGDFRIVHSRVYTSNFTPPTSPLTAIANTELLLNFQDSAIPDLSGINNIDTVGNAKVGASDPTKYGSNAMQFDGTGDYIEAVYPSGLYDGFNDMDWTIEAWVYPKADEDDRGGIVELYTTDTHYIRLMYLPGSTSGNVDFQFSGNGFDIQSGNFSELAWYHVAGVSYNGTLTLYVNGTAIGSDSGYNLSSVVDPRVVIGFDLVNVDRYTDGYIDDVRITKGVARYTADFTPPTAALPKF